MTSSVGDTAMFAPLAQATIDQLTTDLAVARLKLQAQDERLAEQAVAAKVGE